jgi:uncharacterized protein (TIGR03118 family)
MKHTTTAVVLAATLTFGPKVATAQYKQINLVGDKPGLAARTDPNLKDPWGVATFHNGGPFFVANRVTGLITSYSPSGQPLPLQISVPAASNTPPGTPGSPTGLVANSTPDFVISKNGRSGPALLILDTLDGLICGWNPRVDPTHAVVIHDNSAASPFPASYTALALSRNSEGHPVLYAADSGGSLTTSNNQIAMYDGEFKLIGTFGDPLAPPNMTVFGVQNIGAEIYVTYAAFTLLQGGVVDIFNADGQFLRQFAKTTGAGTLEEPWAVVPAPKNFGPFGGALLIGNLEDGRISAFDPETGQFLGQLEDSRGTPISLGLGLWALTFRKDKLFFATGINDGGLFGFIVPVEKHGD